MLSKLIIVRFIVNGFFWWFVFWSKNFGEVMNLFLSRRKLMFKVIIFFDKCVCLSVFFIVMVIFFFKWNWLDCKRIRLIFVFIVMLLVFGLFLIELRWFLVCIILFLLMSLLFLSNNFVILIIMYFILIGLVV